MLNAVVAGTCGATAVVRAADGDAAAVVDQPPASAAPATQELSADTASSSTEPRPAPATPKKRAYHGRAVRLSEALAERGLRAGPEADGQIVLETAGGRLLPILPDWRGRAFYQDARLRNRRLTLIAHRRDDLGYLQPLMVFTYGDRDEPLFTDYWCDVCSIPMYEIKPCECCQGDIRLRQTPQPPPPEVPPAALSD